MVIRSTIEVVIFVGVAESSTRPTQIPRMRTDQRLKKWHAKVTFNKKKYALGYHKTFEEAHKIAQDFKAQKFTEFYLSYVKNERNTTRACCHIHGRIEPLTTVPETNDP